MIRANTLKMDLLAKCNDGHIHRESDLIPLEPTSAVIDLIEQGQTLPIGDCPECGLLVSLWSADSKSENFAPDRAELFRDSKGAPIKCLSCERFENDHVFVTFYEDHNTTYALCLGRLERTPAE